MKNNDKAARPPFKKGQVTVDGVHFNDDWARKLKPLTVDGSEVSAEDRFVNEFKAAHWGDKDENERIELLKSTYADCLAAID